MERAGGGLEVGHVAQRDQPDGQRYFTVSRTIERPIKTGLTTGLPATGPGCGLRHAHKSHCADGIDVGNPAVTPLGPARAICPRIDCSGRVTPPVGRMLAIDISRKTIRLIHSSAG